MGDRHRSRIEEAHGAGGKLNMNIDSVRLLDGEKAALRAVEEVKGGGHTGAMTGGIVATAIVFWPAAPFFLFMHGKDITVPKGTEITAYVNGNFPIDTAKFQSTGQTVRESAANTTSAVIPGSATSNNAAMLDISSTPPDADIEIDGAFGGNTPSSLGVGPGEHTIRVSKKGYTPWERKIRSSSGTVHIVADLELSATPTAAPAISPAEPTIAVSPQTSATASQPAPTVPHPASSPAPQLRPAVMTSTEAQPASTAHKEESVTASSASSEAPVTVAEGSVSITSNPDDAEVFIDSIGRGHTPAVLKLKPGKHKVQLVADGYKDWVGEIEVKSGSVVTVTGKLDK